MLREALAASDFNILCDEKYPIPRRVIGKHSNSGHEATAIMQRCICIGRTHRWHRVAWDHTTDRPRLKTNRFLFVRNVSLQTDRQIRGRRVLPFVVDATLTLLLILHTWHRIDDPFSNILERKASMRLRIITHQRRSIKICYIHSRIYRENKLSKRMTLTCISCDAM